MGRTGKPAEAAQEGQEAQRMDADIQEQETAVETIQEAAEPRREIIGPEDESELLGCQDEDGTQGCQPLEYAVAGCEALNLRERPGMDSPVITALPRGVGVSDTGETEGDWWQVSTGTLTGWVLSSYLEPVWF